MTSYHNDQPIIDSQHDQLNRLSFSASLAQIASLEVGSPCLTISIEGAWGVGKTSIINLVQQCLDESPNPPIVTHYNPWINGKGKSLVEDFLVQFTSQLGLANHADNGVQAAKELLSYSKLFSVAKLVPGVEPFGSIIENILKGVGDATQSLSELKQLDVQGQKEKVIKSIQKLDKPIVIIIDDIDRLTPNECFQILRLIKAIADFPRTTFLLAFDPIYLESVLTSNNISNAGQYIDKIVQLRLPVPIVTEDDLDELVNSTFEHLGADFTFEQYQEDKDRFSYIYHRHIKGILSSPRDIKRVVNHFKFVYQIVKHEVSTIDLFVLSILATKYNKIYEHIKSNPFQYASKHNGKNYWLTRTDRKQAMKEAKQERVAIYNQMNISTGNSVEGLLKEIFPTISEEFHYKSYSVNDADAAGRVDSLDRLSTALHIATPRGMCSDNDVRMFIKDPDANMSLFTNSIIQNSTARFLELYDFEMERKEYPLLHYIHSLRRIAEELIANNHFRQANDLFDDLFIKTSSLTALSRLVRKILQNEEATVQLVNSVIDELCLLPFIADTVHTLLGHYKSTVNEPAWVSEKEANAIMDTYTNAARKALEETQLESHILQYHLIRPIWLWREHHAKEIIKTVNPKEILRLGYLLIGGRGSTSTNGIYLSVNLDNVASIFNISELKASATTLLESTSDPLEKAILLSMTDGSKRYIKDGTVEVGW
ncbi:P-loop NTPase fold protein [Vibrio sp. 10N.222.54.B12]|uniref:KAP family P-loop NTPase fold protein n=1 Tax=Vibrio sp. 10N.222.54.B12 TaxID=3229636 RepID=UPI00354C8114